MISVMIVILHGRSPIELVALDLRDSLASPMYQAPTIVHACARVYFLSTDGTSLITHVIFVMIVILKTFYV